MRRTTLISTLVICASTACSDDAREASTFDSWGSTGGGGNDSTGSGDGGEAHTGDGQSGDGDGDSSDPGDGDGDSSDPGDGDGDGDPSDDHQPVPCDIPVAKLVKLTPHVVLVLDKSGSMIQNSWDHDGNPQTPKITRWKSLHNVVSSIVGKFEDQVDFGAQLYPSAQATNDYDASACSVSSPPEVLVAPDNAIGVLLGIPIGNSQNIRGGTPTAVGISSAIDHLLDIDDGDPAAIVLVTDGAANCRIDAGSEFERFETYDPNLLPIVVDAYNDLQIPTYVVGIDIADAMTPISGQNHPPDGEPDGINPFAKLNELAVAGGKPLGGIADFYQTHNEIELQAALQAIVDDAISCTLVLDPMPAFPHLMEVVIDGEQVPKVDDCHSQDGWVYSQPNGPYDSLELCGSYCAMISQVEQFEAAYYCDPA